MKALLSFSLLLAILCSQRLNFLSVDAKSILRPGEKLNSTSKLVSDYGIFTLGFFTIPVTNYSYMGIWYTNDDWARRVWVGNPNTPLINNSRVLTIDSSGTLKIINGGNTVLNISNHTGTSNTSAKLEDSGNFVLVDAVDKRTLWQSFDHPTNTLLPGMRLGFNRSTGENRTLISWLSDYIPASGAFTLGLESIQGSGQLVIRLRGELFWTSGPWNNQNFQFTSALTLPSNLYKYNLSFTSDNDAMYFTFDIFGETTTPLLELSSVGYIVEAASSLIVTPYGNEFCYGYESDNGCVASHLPTCRSNSDAFKIKSGYFPYSSNTFDHNSSLSLADCMERCWNDCSCVGFIDVHSNRTGCQIVYGNVGFQVDESGFTARTYVLVSEKSSKGKSWIWIVIALVIVVVLLLSSLLGYQVRKRRILEGEERRRKEEFLTLLSNTDSFNDANEIEMNGREPHDLKIFSFGSIMVATNSFSSENKLGEGGFGPVYKGRLLDGREIAVKRLSRTSGQGIVELKNELILISKLQHTNLVRVLGCCIHQEEKMLIYEFMPNKSLDFFLFAADRKERLNWRTRFNIMEGVAQGLLYLHKYSRMRVIHRDLKVSNILLDENMHPKIADFGMARIFKQNETEAITKRVVGTYGYMSPEYAMEGTFSIKSDVFSFGVLVLEIVSGRKNNSFYNLDRAVNLIGYAWELWKQGNALELKDPLLGDSCDTNQMFRAIHVGLLCVQENAMDRPKMEDVISMLSSETMALPSPKQPAYYTGRNILESTSSDDKAKGNSADDFITEVEAR